MIGPHPARRPRRTAAAAGWVAFAVLLAVVLLDGTLHRTEAVGEVERQPASVEYEDGGAHYVRMIERSSLLFGRHQAYELRTGRDPGLGYGHVVGLDFGGEPPEIETVHWDETGIQVTFTSGHRVFVPARHYLGGR